MAESSAVEKSLEVNGPRKQITTAAIDLTATIVEGEKIDTIADAIVEDLLPAAHAHPGDLTVATTIQTAIMSVVVVPVDIDIAVVTIDLTIVATANIAEEQAET